MDYNQTQEEALGESLNIREIIKPYIYRWYWFIIGAIVAVIVAWFFLRYSIPVYSTESTLLIKEVKYLRQQDNSDNKQENSIAKIELPPHY